MSVNRRHRCLTGRRLLRRVLDADLGARGEGLKAKPADFADCAGARGGHDISGLVVE
jgi:hypothetical protein